MNAFGADTDKDVTDWGEVNMEEKRRAMPFAVQEVRNVAKQLGPIDRELIEAAADEVERLQHLLRGRDDFLVHIGQFQAFVDQLPKPRQ